MNSHHGAVTLARYACNLMSTVEREGAVVNVLGRDTQIVIALDLGFGQSHKTKQQGQSFNMKLQHQNAA
jgi:hypothetical protein